MQTPPPINFIRESDAGPQAEALLRGCVFCGACNSVCPTYQLLGEERDGPRGRIYQMKMVLEGRQAATRETLEHLDRCLMCRACERICASGMHYSTLLDLARPLIESQVSRPWHQRLARAAVRAVVPHRARFTPLLRAGQLLRPVAPGALKRMIPPRRRAADWPAPRHARRMLILDGCAQPAIAPNINAATARALDRLGISLLRAEQAGCCGALHQHTSDADGALEFVRRNVDAWWPHIEAGCEAIVITASGCGRHVKEYGYLLREDPNYADKARRVSELARDVSEIFVREDLAPLKSSVRAGTRIAFQSPCSLQHGQMLHNVVEKILTELGFVLTQVPDAHVCCGAAGSYALLQPKLSRRLRDNKLANLQSDGPELIATANIGCLVHLQGEAGMPVRHWIELL